MQISTRARAAVAGLAVAALVGSGAGAAAAGAEEAAEPAAESTGCRVGTWPAEAEGQPVAFQAGAAAGAYLWHSATGWHLRVTHPGSSKAVFRGTIASGARLHGVARRTEAADAVVTTGRHRIGFRFTNYGAVDGVDFRVGCGPG